MPRAQHYQRFFDCLERPTTSLAVLKEAREEYVRIR